MKIFSELTPSHPRPVVVANSQLMLPPALTPCTQDCPICGGSGWVRQDVAIDHPLFGRLTLCPQADLFRMPNAVRYGVSPKENAVLNWDVILERANVMEAVSAVQTTLSRGYGWVYLWGDFGQGKTLILKIAILESLRAQKFAAYARMAHIVEDLRKAVLEHHEVGESTQQFAWWARQPVLAIDEIDRIRKTEFAQEQQYLLLDQRYEQALQKQSVTLLAANSAPQTLDGYLADRILDDRFAVVHLAGQSARLGMDWDL